MPSWSARASAYRCVEPSSATGQAAHYDEVLVVRTSVKGMRAASVTFEYEIHNEAGTRIATGIIELACVNLKTEERKPVALPAELRSLLS